MPLPPPPLPLMFATGDDSLRNSRGAIIVEMSDTLLRMFAYAFDAPTYEDAQERARAAVSAYALGGMQAVEALLAAAPKEP